MDLQSDVLALGGVAATHELLVRGYSLDRLAVSRRDAELVRPRKGWYVHPSVGHAVVEAVRVGGRLACCSAAAHHGLWVPDHADLHVEVVGHASRLRTRQDHRLRIADSTRSDVVVHWGGIGSNGDRRAVNVDHAVSQVYQCMGDQAGFVVLESALHRGLLSTFAQSVLLESLPRRMRRSARLASRLSESGTESFLKLGLIRLRIRFLQQVLIGGVGRVDFLIGDRLVIEVDSRAHHSDPYADRRRDAELGVRGYRVLRFIYSQIVHEWPMVEAAIIASMSRGDHLAA